MQANYNFHWVRASTAEPDIDAVLATFGKPEVAGGFGPITKSGAFNQPAHYLHDTGVKVYFGSKNPEQRIVIECPGEACEKVHYRHLMGWFTALPDCRLTRVDVAADVYPVSTATRRLRQMRRDFERGHCSTMIEPTSTEFYESKREGEGRTLYVGSRTSELFIRAYDRRGPLRIEPQYMPADRRVRTSLPALLIEHGPAALWRTLMARCTWPRPWFSDLMTGHNLDLHATPEDLPDLPAAIATLCQNNRAALVACAKLRITVDELATMALNASPTNSREVQKWAKWSDEAPELGYDPTDLATLVASNRKRATPPKEATHEAANQGRSN